MDAEKMARGFDAWWKSIAVSSEEPEMMDDRTLAETAWNAAIALSPPASAGEGHIPKVQATAPKRIWLAVADDKHYADEPFPEGVEEICWSHDAPLEVCVPYIRADLAPTPPAAAQEDGRDATVVIDAEDYLHALDMLWQAHGGDNNYPLYRKFADFLPQATADRALSLTSPDSGKEG